MAAAISHPTPAYSKAALQLKMEGKVGITLCVNREGAVIDTVISYGNPVLTQMAVDGVKEWKFKPFHDESGKLAKAMFPITIDFHLPKKA
jgi:TonB family protein